MDILLPPAPVESLMVCPVCKVEMQLLGVEAETPVRDLYTFDCPQCGRLEVRGVNSR